MKRKKSNLVKENVQNLNNTVKGILLFCDNMPNNKPDHPTDILAWKVSLPLTAKNASDQLITISIEKGLINNAKEITMNYARNIIVGNNIFGDVL